MALNESSLLRLREVVGPDQFSTGISNLSLHAKDESFHTPHLPDVVIWPRSTEDVSRIMKICSEDEIPVTPWGAGTSLEGNPIPVRGGVVIDLQQMNEILRIRENDLQVDVQAGVLFKDLNKRLARYGLFCPPDPGASATIGGMVANNASGIRAIKYGATKDLIQKLTVVLADGKVIQPGTLAFKTSSGLDLCRLFAGSEGILGIITEITLRLVGIPPEFLSSVVSFSTTEAASLTISQIIRSGLAPAALELISTNCVLLINKYTEDFNFPESPLVFIEFHGSSKEGLAADLELVRELCKDNGATRFEAGIGRQARSKLWEARYNLHDFILREHPGLEPMAIDTAVPISKLPDIVAYAEEITKSRGVIGYVFGHAGSGNIHMPMMGDPNDKASWSVLEEINHKLVEYAISLGGTATGEHGVGIGKIQFMELEHGKSLEIMHRIKNLFDPKGILNPGKMF